ncbi:MAG: toprim domain-containing protein, partial [Cyanobacteria bacterium P01_H01_bin.130]
MPFNILEWRDRLEIVKETRSQIVCKCPVCGGTNLKIDPKSGKWQCWDYPDDEKHKRAIRDAINPPKRQNDLQQKPSRVAQKRQWIYECDEPEHRIRVDRTDYNPPKVGRGGKPIEREIFQSYKHKNRWVKGGQLDDVTKDHIRSHVLPLYHQEIIDNITPSDLLFICEGEPCVDAMRSLGLFATTVVGAKWSVRDYSEIFRELGDRLIIVPDRDKAGARFAMEAFALFPEARWMHPYPNSPVWEKLPKSGGIDVGDWILVSGANREDIEDAITSLPKVAIANWDQEHALPATAPAPAQALQTINLQAEINHIIERELGEGDTAAALMDLSKRTGERLGEIKCLYKACLNDYARGEALREGVKNLQPLLKYARQDIPLETILPLDLARALR